MIALALLHPHQLEPLHHWTFDQPSLIRIGRSQDNDVILYSAVISRHHLELHYRSGQWWAINRGKNGTYCNNEAIKHLRLLDQMTLCLAKSGPRLRILIADHIQPEPSMSRSTQSQGTMSEAEEQDEMTIANIDVGVLG